MAELTPLSILITADADDLKAELSAARAALNKFETAASKGAKGSTALGGAMNKLGNVSGSTRAKIQMTSYQLQDIAVQLQMGTRASTVMAQQLPQLASAFGPVGAIVGTLAAVGIPALAFAFGSARDEAKSLSERVEDLDEVVSGFEGAAVAASSSIDTLKKKYGELAASMQPVLDLQRQLAEAASASDISAAASALADWADFYDSAGGFRGSQGVTGFFDVNQIFTVTQAQRDLRREADALGEEFLEIRDAIKGAGDNIELQHAKTKELLQTTITLADLDGKRTDKEKEFIGILTQIIDKQAQHIALKNKDKQIARGMLADLVQEAAMRDAIAKHGKDSLQVSWLRYDAERKTLESQLSTLDVSEDIKTEIRAAFDAANDLANLDITTNLLGVLGVAQDIAGAFNSIGGGTVVNPRVGSVTLGFSKGKDGTYNSGDKPDNKPGGGGGGGARTNPLEGQLEALQNSLMTQEEAQIASFERQQETLRSALEQKLLTTEEYNSLMEDAQQKHSDKMVSIDAYRHGDALQATGAFLGDMANALAQGNEKMMQISKVFGAAEALISAYKGAAKELEKGVFGFATAATVLAKGFAFVQAIQGVGKGGGGRTSTGGSSAGSVAAASPPAAQTTNRSLTLIGDNFNRQQAVQIAEFLNEGSDDGLIVRGR